MSLKEELELWLFESRASPCVGSLAVLLKACEHRELHSAARYLDERERLDYYSQCGLKYLPPEHVGILRPVAQDLRTTPERLAEAVLVSFVAQRGFLVGMDTWIADAMRISNTREFLKPEIRCQQCRNLVPQTSFKQRYCSNACENPPAEPVIDTHGF